MNYTLAMGLRTSFEYTNWRGVTANRHVVPLRLIYGTTDWHKEPQWLLVAIDLSINEERQFALKDIAPYTIHQEL